MLRPFLILMKARVQTPWFANEQTDSESLNDSPRSHSLDGQNQGGSPDCLTPHLLINADNCVGALQSLDT